MEERRFADMDGGWSVKAGLLCYGRAGGYAWCKRRKWWQTQQSGNRLVFQDALGQQSGCVWRDRRPTPWGAMGEAELRRTSGGEAVSAAARRDNWRGWCG